MLGAEWLKRCGPEALGQVLQTGGSVERGSILHRTTVEAALQYLQAHQTALLQNLRVEWLLGELLREPAQQLGLASQVQNSSATSTHLH